MARATVVYVIARRGRNYGLRFVDPSSGALREISSGTRRRREAEKAALALEARLTRDGCLTDDISWSAFCDRFAREYLPKLSVASRQQWSTAVNHIDRAVFPQRLSDLTTSSLSRWVAALQEQGLAVASIRSYWHTLRAALSWAHELGVLAHMPRVRVPGQGARRARGRGVTEGELERIIAAVPAIRPKDAAVWQAFLRGLYWSGLRVGELAVLSWDARAGISLRPPGPDQPYPLIHFGPGEQKNSEEQWLPVLPEFWGLVTPGEGLVFPLPAKSIKRIVRTISAIGAESGVVVEPISGRTASSHDLGRRAFLSRLGDQVSLPDLRQWARHSTVETTLSYYAHRTAADLAAKIWSAGDQPPRRSATAGQPRKR